MKPEGTLIIIGGSEDKGGERSYIKDYNRAYLGLEILKECISQTSNKHIEIITTGSSVPATLKKDYQKAFRKLGYQPKFIDVKTREEAENNELLDRLKSAATVFFTGGSQAKLAAILGGTPLLKIIKHKYYHDKNFIVAGTSAGAMVVADLIIMAGNTAEVVLGKDLKISAGFGFLHNCIIDTHFIKRQRLGRLMHAVLMNPKLLGVGLGEDTALLIKRGSEAQCYGSGMVVIIDAEKIGMNNIVDLSENEPLYVENLTIHILVTGCRFSFEKRKMVSPVKKKS